MWLTEFNITIAAQSYSQVTGVLAGFGMTIIVLLVDRIIPPDSGQEASPNVQRALALLSYAVMANMVCAVFYGHISGDTTELRIRPLVLGLITNILFVMSIQIMLEALALIVLQRQIPEVAGLRRYLLFAATIILVMDVMGISVGVLNAQLGHTSFGETIRNNLTFLLTLLAFLSVPPLMGGILNLNLLNTRLRLESTKSFWAFFIVLLVWTLGMVGGFSFVSSFPADQSLSQLSLLIMGGTWSILMGWSLVFIPV